MNFIYDPRVFPEKEFSITLEDLELFFNEEGQMEFRIIQIPIDKAIEMLYN